MLKRLNKLISINLQVHLTWSYGASSTIWQGIQQISAGCFKEFRLNNKTSEIKTNLEFPYWDWCKLIADQEPNVRKITSDDIARFKYELESAVKRQTMSDVGYTSYVSVGIDSAVIALLLNHARSCQHTLLTLLTTTIARFLAKTCAQQVEANHHIISK